MSSLVVFYPNDAQLPSSNMPAPGVDAQNRPYLAFDAATDETCYFTGIAPQSLSGALSFVLTYRMASATTGACRWQAAIEAITDGDAVDTDAASSFDTQNSNGATVPGTAGYIDQISITMTNADSIAAGDYYRIAVNRDANATSGTDDASGDSQLLTAELRDSA